MPKLFCQSCRLRVLITMLIVVLSLLTACTPKEAASTPTPSPTWTADQTATPNPTITPRPTATPTLPPLGEAGNPVTFGFVLPQLANADIAAEDLTNLLSSETGYAIEVLLYPDFESLSTAIVQAEVDLFWVNPLEYLYLNEQGFAEVMLMTNHQGVFSYGVQFIANIYRGFEHFFDPETSENTADILPALQQFAGTRPCFLDPNSTPGYYVPMGLLAITSTPTQDPVFVYSYNAIIRAIYIQGICDFGVTYALTGDPLTSSDIMFNLPDAQNQVFVVWRSEGLIPNVGLSASPNLPVFMRFRIEEAMLRIADSADGLYIISSALDYQVEALRSVEDNFYNGFRSVVYPLALDLQALTHAAPQQ